MSLPILVIFQFIHWWVSCTLQNSVLWAHGKTEKSFFSCFKRFIFKDVPAQNKKKIHLSAFLFFFLSLLKYSFFFFSVITPNFYKHFAQKEKYWGYALHFEYLVYYFDHERIKVVKYLPKLFDDD